uniref:Collagen alpha-1(XVIII) chain n=1 Tax=Parascaris univalens TaxID=6257 RepID=A0A915C6C9_PARUN
MRIIICYFIDDILSMNAPSGDDLLLCVCVCVCVYVYVYILRLIAITLISSLRHYHNFSAHFRSFFISFFTRI